MCDHVFRRRGQNKGIFFCTPSVLLDFTFFQSRWLGGFCTMKKCIPSSCMCRASVYESDFFYFLIPLPRSSLFGLVRSRGIECRLLELRLPGWVRIQPWVSACGLAGPWCHQGVLGWPGLCSPFHPTPWSCSFKSNKQSARRCAVGEIAAPIGHCNGWFKSHGDPSFYFFVWLHLWKMQSSWIPAGSLIQEKCQEIKLSATCKRVKVLENAPKHNPSS